MGTSEHAHGRLKKVKAKEAPTNIEHGVFRLRLIVHTVEARNMLQEAMEVRMRTEREVFTNRVEM